MFIEKFLFSVVINIFWNLREKTHEKYFPKIIMIWLSELIQIAIY